MILDNRNPGSFPHVSHIGHKSRSGWGLEGGL